MSKNARAISSVCTVSRVDVCRNCRLMVYNCIFKVGGEKSLLKRFVSASLSSTLATGMIACLMTNTEMVSRYLGLLKNDGTVRQA